MAVTIELKPLVGERRSRLSATSYNIVSIGRFKRSKKLFPIILACLLITLFYGYLRSVGSNDEKSMIQSLRVEIDPEEIQVISQQQQQQPSNIGQEIVEPDARAIAVNKEPAEQLVNQRPGQEQPADQRSAEHEAAVQPNEHPGDQQFVEQSVLNHQPVGQNDQQRSAEHLLDHAGAEPQSPDQQPVVQPANQNQESDVVADAAVAQVLADEDIRPAKLPPHTKDHTEGHPACELPELVPFHPSIADMTGPPSPLDCTSKDYPKLFEVDLNSNLLRLEDPTQYGYHDCCFSEIKRKPNDDEEVQLSDDCEPITHDRTEIRESYETIMVSCVFSGTNNTWKDVDIFGLPRLKPKAENEGKTFGGDELNVVILGLDSMSNMNFQRTMQASHKYITENLHAFALEGYTKVGDNTFPNLVATLTGQTVAQLSDTCWKAEYFDACSFLWNNFSAQGYYTVFGEDAPFMSAFNYYKKGFQSPPVDYYLRPLFLAQDLYTGHEDLLNSNICYGPRLAFDVILQYMKRMAVTMARESSRYFEFLWATTLFHDDVNMPILGDQNLLETLKWFSESGHLENSIFFLMSDHGMRWGAIRETLQGKIEERMPLFNAIFPSWFSQKYPRAFKNLEDNKRRLTTPFDVHETLLDLLNPTKLLGDGSVRKREEELLKNVKNGRMPRGISLFLPVPPSRNCKKAEVDAHWCTCSSLKEAEINSHESQEAAAVVVGYINKILEAYPECATLELDSIIQVHELIQQGNLDYDYYDGLAKQNGGDGGLLDGLAKDEGNKAKKKEKQFEISLRTVPGLADFEATVSQGQEGEWSIDGAISRTNMYGNQSRCISQPELKLFCFCV